MPAELDSRDPRFRPDEELFRSMQAETDHVSALLPDQQAVSFRRANPCTATPAALHVSESPSVEEPSAHHALDLLQTAAPVFGLSTSTAEFVPDPAVLQTSTGTSVIHLQQHHRGVPIFEMVRTVVYDQAGRARRVIGENCTVPTDLSVVPRVTVLDAARRAAEHLASTGDDHAEDLLAWEPEIAVAFPVATRPTVLEGGPFDEPVSAHLIVFHRGSDTRLGWHLLFTFARTHDQYAVIVAADHGDQRDEGASNDQRDEGASGDQRDEGASGDQRDEGASNDHGDDGGIEVLYCRRTSLEVGEVRARVHRRNPGTREYETVTFPPLADAYVLPVPDTIVGFPSAWCARSDTDGVYARTTDAEKRLPLSGIEDGTTIVFEPSDPLGTDQCILNAFYFCSLAHDLFLLLGFDEGSGNFQSTNIGLDGFPGDPVVVRVRDERIAGEANMTCGRDGRPPVMQLGRNQRSGRHTALDSDVVLHEYVHAVTTRLVGGIGNLSSLEQPQSAGLGEGWSDYFALTLQNCVFGTDRTVLGTWSSASEKGMRAHPYDERFPADFGDIGSGRYTERHALGEIWAATLVQMNRELGAALGSAQEGHLLGWRIVLDGLRLTRSSPSFLDARDAMLEALDDLVTAGRVPQMQPTVAEIMWRVFARFGMGRTATCRGPSFEGIVRSEAT